MTLRTHLDSYCKAFNDRSPEATLVLFSEHALFEMPLLGQRLIGKGEIAAGLQRMFEITEAARLAFSDVVESDRLLIAEGELHAKLHRDASAVTMPAALTLEAREGKIVRLSIYLDARPYRLWSDGAIFATTSSALQQ